MKLWQHLNRSDAVCVFTALSTYRHKSGKYNSLLASLLELARRVIWEAIWKSKSVIKDASISPEDLHQDVMLWLSQNWRKWNPHRGAWSTWVTLHTRRHISRIASRGPLSMLPKGCEVYKTKDRHLLRDRLTAKASPLPLDAYPDWGITYRESTTDHGGTEQHAIMGGRLMLSAQGEHEESESM